MIEIVVIVLNASVRDVVEHLHGKFGGFLFSFFQVSMSKDIHFCMEVSDVVFVIVIVMKCAVLQAPTAGTHS